jgi:hypothetical protein
MSKFSENQSLGSADIGPVSYIKDVSKFEKFAIQIVYAADSDNSNTANASLECCLDYSSDNVSSGNWTTVANSTQALDTAAGGVHIWNVSDFIAPFLKVVIDGYVENVEVQFVGDPQPKRG